MTRRSTLPLVPKDEGLFSALSELGDLVKNRPELADKVRELLFEGVARCEVDWQATEETGECVALYKPSKELMAFLAAARVLDRHH